jgi:hypothetical protein
MTNSQPRQGTQVYTSTYENDAASVQGGRQLTGSPSRPLLMFPLTEVIAEITLSILEGTDHGTPALPV